MRLLLCLVLLTLVAGGCTAGRRVSVSCPPEGQGPAAPFPDAAFCRLPEAAYLLMGESHTSPCDHAAQRTLMEMIGASRSGQWPQGTPVVALEMVATDRQRVLDRFNNKLIGLQELRQELDWDRTWGHPWELYAPVFQAARDAGLPLHAANVPQRLVELVRTKGLDAAAAEAGEDGIHLPETIILPQQEQLEFLREFFSRHSEMLRKQDDAGFERFIRIQSLWDTAMARNLVRLRQQTGRPVLLIVGSGHVEHGWGVKRRLREFDPGAPVLSLLPVRDPEDLQDAPAGELRFLCPPSHFSRLGYAVEEGEAGVVLTAVIAGSPAAGLGMQVGDVLLAINDIPVDGIGDLHVIPMQLKGDTLRYRLRRGEAELELTLNRSPR
ncbi:ChaN family lipoprotein [Megalodesulfovibrio gigas]|uniref:PDZ domain-containing protein n=1 Tax=Megalodesulfovibrio gigas (strain ATCC 19364 / DSM 1382 / NCIMB 9332 / VKM B-1759) TaxID=1121448 RepID=T2GFD3_MEGG1|nr:ChaN family lipoprotein [Megalodesulfovibrio gigas]AGW14602.1 hypothetical protein DGI_2875 [Megalodesulfovibrio gigas DSM 1382 = ATCC 19364]